MNLSLIKMVVAILLLVRLSSLLIFWSMYESIASFFVSFM